MRAATRMVVVLVLASSAWAGKVKAEADKTVDYSTFKTFAWTTGRAVPRPLVDLSVIGSIEKQLKARGLTPAADAEHADVLVRYFAAANGSITFAANDPTYSTVGGYPVNSSYLWQNNWWDRGSLMKEGSLEVELFDRAKHIMIYRAKASDIIKPDTKLGKQIDEVVTKMFQKYPVKPAR